MSRQQGSEFPWQARIAVFIGCCAAGGAVLGALYAGIWWLKFGLAATSLLLVVASVLTFLYFLTPATHKLPDQPA